MSDIGMPKQWTEEQWSRAQQVVHDQALKARVAGRFLPLYGPVPPGNATVPRQLVTDKTAALAIREPKTLDLITVAINLELTTTQQSEPDLSSALTLFARAANIIARTEDGIIFQGKDPKIHPSCMVNPAPLLSHGLLNAPQASNKLLIYPDQQSGKVTGEELVTRVAEGLTVLDGEGYLAPYALVLGEGLFLIAQTPNKDGLVLPSDRIRPLIEGPLLRSGSLPAATGVLVSLAANPVEIVVASDIHVRFLQLTAGSRYLYRVSQRFALRIKEPNAIVTLAVAVPTTPPPPTPGTPLSSTTATAAPPSPAVPPLTSTSASSTATPVSTILATTPTATALVTTQASAVPTAVQESNSSGSTLAAKIGIANKGEDDTEKNRGKASNGN